MRIAILGATSQIARDLIVSFSGVANKYLHLFARRPDEVTKWLASVGLSGRYPVDDFSGLLNRSSCAISEAHCTVFEKHAALRLTRVEFLRGI